MITLIKPLTVMKPIIIENYDVNTKTMKSQSIQYFNEPTIQDYIKSGNFENYIFKVGDITKSNSHKCGYSVQVFSEYKYHEQWVYVLVIDNHIIKFGDTTKSIKHRWGSYSAGTRENRERGTCSVTNYFISELIREAHKMGLSIELFGYPIETKEVKINVFPDSILGNEVVDTPSVCDHYESKLIETFNYLYNKLPILGRNGLVK